MILAGRNPERVEQAARQFRADTGVKVDVLALDLNSLASVRGAAVKCKEMLQAGRSGDKELHSVVCNAGAQFKGPVTYSVDGYEETFAGNCLGKPISAGRRYATSKLCTILNAYEMDRRLRRAGSFVPSIAYDPGFIPEIGMGNHAPAIFRSPVVKFFLRKLGMTMGQMPLRRGAWNAGGGCCFRSKVGQVFLFEGRCTKRSQIISRIIK